MGRVKEMARKQIAIETHSGIADRDTIEDAFEYNRKIWRTLDKQDRLYVEIAFFVFWNTLGKHYEVYKKGGTNV
jgi:hypothetical protein